VCVSYAAILMMMTLHTSLKFCWCKGCVCIISCHINDDDVAYFFKYCWCKGCVCIICGHIYDDDDHACFIEIVLVLRACVSYCHINDDDVACFFEVLLVQRMCVYHMRPYI